MNSEMVIKELADELRAAKAGYEQVSSSLILYNYTLDVPVHQVGNLYFIDCFVTLTTSDGSNTLASIEGATYDRVPYEGGAKFYLRRKIGSEVVLYTMQDGEITIT